MILTGVYEDFAFIIFVAAVFYLIDILRNVIFDVVEAEDNTHFKVLFWIGIILIFYLIFKKEQQRRDEKDRDDKIDGDDRRDKND